MTQANRRSTAGRPRADGTVSDSPRDDILAVALRLFAEQGFAQTTMTKIAHESGLRQASLYYWFANKEELLRATAAVNRSAVEVAEALAEAHVAPEVKLFRLLYDDTRFMCQGPCDYQEIERLAVQQPEHFASFWSDYRVLFAAIRGFLADAMAVGSIDRQSDPDGVAMAALALNEGLQKVCHLRRSDRHWYLPLPEAGVPTYADRSASTTLAGLLVDRGALPAVRQQALGLELGPAQKNSR